MQEIFFEWDFRKNDLNIKKHNVSFTEAIEVFSDEKAILFDDPDHSVEEERFLIIGMTAESKICVVSHCYKEEIVTLQRYQFKKHCVNSLFYF